MNKLNKILLGLVACLAIFLLTIRSYAMTAVKSVKLELPKDYEVCTFSLEFEEGKDNISSASLVSPSGMRYDFSYNETTQLYQCAVADVKKGAWIAEITKDTPNGNPDEVGKVTFSVKSEADIKSEIGANVKVAREIAGLKYYWKDNSICVEWTDGSVGNLSVKVTDSKTRQIINQQNATDYYYEAQIPEDVEEIILDIVPATSNGVAGASSTFISHKPECPYKVSPASFTGRYSNTGYYKVFIEFGADARLEYYNNGQSEPFTTDFYTGGDNEYVELPIKEGYNNGTLWIIDRNSNMFSWELEVIGDSIPPILQIDKDISNLETYSSSVKIAGKVEDYTELHIGSEKIEPTSSGDFEVTAKLLDGENLIEITAEDAAGNINVYSATVVKKVRDYTFAFILAGVLLFAIVAVLVVKTVRKRKDSPSLETILEENISEDELDDSAEADTQPKKKEDSKAKKPRTKNELERMKSLYSWIYTGIICLILIIFFTLVIGTGKVMSASMEPTLMTGEFEVINKLAYKVREPQRGDVVTFKDSEKRILCKRVIGLPGDSISFKDGYLYINNVLCDESAYLGEEVETNSEKEFVVPENCYFMLGDNRENSNDSRFWSEPYVDRHRIVGKVIFHVNFK